jgi:hypothetical protein
MAFATKYRYTFYELGGSQVQVDLQLDGYAGSVNTRNAVPDNPVTIRWECEDPDDKFSPIFKSSCVARFSIANSGESLRELITSAEKQYRLIIYIGGSVNFKGYVLPGYYSESFTDTYPTTVDVLATDGLSSLADIDYLSGAGLKINGLSTLLSIMQGMLNDVNEASYLRVYNNLIEDTFTDSDSTTLLEQTYINNELFYDPETSEPWKKLDVLKAILRTIGSRLFMTGGEWSIVRISEYTNSTVPYVKFTSAGAYSSKGTTVLKSSITSATASKATRVVPLGGMGVLTAVMSPKSIIVRHLSSFKENAMQYGGFTDWSDANTPTGWTLNLTNAPTKISSPDTGFICSLPAQTAGDYLYTSAAKGDMHNLLSYNSKLTFRYRNAGTFNISFSIRVYVQTGAGYYLQSAIAWTTTPTDITFTSVVPSDDYTDYVLNFVPPPGTEYIKIYIYPQTSNGPLYVDEFKLEHINSEYYPKPADYIDYQSIINAANRSGDEVVELFMGDLDYTGSDYNDSHCRNWLRADASGLYQTSMWGYKGGIQDTKIQNVLRADMYNQLSLPYFRLSCDFEGNIAASKLLVDTSDASKCYLPMRLEYNVANREFSGDWLQII